MFIQVDEVQRYAESNGCPVQPVAVPLTLPPSEQVGQRFVVQLPKGYPIVRRDRPCFHARKSNAYDSVSNSVSIVSLAYYAGMSDPRSSTAAFS